MYRNELNFPVAQSSPSYVIVNINTGKALFETFNKKVADAINTKRYRAVPIGEYLASLNGKAA